jgi:hypothetical protein
MCADGMPDSRKLARTQRRIQETRSMSAWLRLARVPVSSAEARFSVARERTGESRWRGALRFLSWVQADDLQPCGLAQVRATRRTLRTQREFE